MSLSADSNPRLRDNSTIFLNANASELQSEVTFSSILTGGKTVDPNPTINSYNKIHFGTSPGLFQKRRARHQK